MGDEFSIFRWTGHGDMWMFAVGENAGGKIPMPDGKDVAAMIAYHLLSHFRVEEAKAPGGRQESDANVNEGGQELLHLSQMYLA